MGLTMESVENKKAYGLIQVLQRGGLTTSQIARGSGVAISTVWPFTIPSNRRLSKRVYERIVAFYERVKKDPTFKEKIEAWRLEYEAQQRVEEKNVKHSDAVTSAPEQPDEEASQPEATAASAADDAATSTPDNDIVNSPSHYRRVAVTIEPIDVTSRLPHPIASALEYIVRAGHKAGQTKEIDLSKARFWLTHWMGMKGRTYALNVYEISLLIVFLEENDIAQPLFARTLGIALASIEKAECLSDSVRVPTEETDKDARDMIAAIDRILAGKEDGHE